MSARNASQGSSGSISRRRPRRRWSRQRSPFRALSTSGTRRTRSAPWRRAPPLRRPRAQSRRPGRTPPRRGAPAGPEPAQGPGIPGTPAVRTVTLADLYWSQGERSVARRIVAEILRNDPGNVRAQAWTAARAGEDLAEADLLRFLEIMTKEDGYDLS